MIQGGWTDDRQQKRTRERNYIVPYGIWQMTFVEVLMDGILNSMS